MFYRTRPPYLFYFTPPGGYIFFVYLLGSYSREDTGGDSVSLRILGAIALHLKFNVYFVSYKPPLRLYANTDRAKPRHTNSSRCLPQSGDTYEERLKIAGNTALLLSELGMDDDISEEEAEQAAQMMAKLKPADSKNQTLAKEEKKALQSTGVALKIGGYLSEYEKQVVAMIRSRYAQ
jgi:hypothetical protein